MTRCKIACTAVALVAAIALGGIDYAWAASRSVHRTPHDSSLIVTAEGPVQGLVAKTDREFLGIPYAAPPIGALRWKPPAPHAAWSAPWDASRFRASCIQPSFGPAHDITGFEDCLYLNIYTPNPPHRHLPVMFWIHGGTFLVGSGSEFDGSVMAAKGKVIVVTINYRLGPLGFLTHKALDAEDPHHVSGNYGLLDQQAALRWVRRNIAAFGGDPARVTIFGESAGGISVCLQMQAPGADGLFARAIDESGPCQIVSSRSTAQAQGDKLVAALRCEHAPHVAACLRSRPAAQVLNAIPASPVGNNNVVWFPVIDGFVLPQTADQAFGSGKFSRVPVINGSNHDEGTLFVSFGPPVTAEQYPVLVRQRFGRNAARVMEEYPLHGYPTPSEAWSAAFTDGFFSCLIRRTTRILAPQVPVYAYEFNDRHAPNVMVPNPPLKLGAYHGAEIQYVFQSRFGKKAPQFSAQQLKLSDRMMSYWTRFGSSGNPDGSAPKWSRYDNAEDRMLSFAPGAVRDESDFARDHHCAFWDTVKVSMPP